MRQHLTQHVVVNEAQTSTQQLQGHILTAQGRFRESVPILHQAWVDFREQRGQHDLRAINAQAIYGSALLDYGRNKEAEIVFATAYALSDPRALGARSTQGEEMQATVAFNLALAIQQQHRWEEAVSWHENALAGRTKTLGPEHEETRRSSFELRRLKVAMGLPTT